MATQPQKSREEILAEMDGWARRARDEYKDMEPKLDPGTMFQIKTWWERNYQKAGHKRLAYILLGKEVR